MCDCQTKKIGKPMNTKKIGGSLMTAALTGAGFVAADYVAGFAAEQFPTVDSKIINGGKIVLGAVVLPMLAKGKTGAYLESLGVGMAVNGIASLYSDLMAPAASTSVAGVDNRMYAMAGVDNAGYALGSSQSRFIRSSAAAAAV